MATYQTFASHTPWWRHKAASVGAGALMVAGVFAILIGLYHVAWVADDLGQLLLIAMFTVWAVVQFLLPSGRR